MTTFRHRKVSSLLLDVEAQTLTITLTDAEGPWYTEQVAEVSVEPGQADPGLLAAARDLVTRALDAAQRKAPAGCGTCQGTCCKTFDVVEVTEADVHRFRLAGLDVSKLVTTFPVPSVTGVVGKLVLGKGNRCKSLGPDGKCKIYAHRPSACRDFSAYSCDMYAPQEKRRRLKVLG